MRAIFLASALGILALSGCSPGSEQAAGEPEPIVDEAANQIEAKGELPSCPFREVHEVRGSIQGGRLLVTGRVDLMMAGFKPQLTLREGGSTAVALDLALVPESQAAVSDVLRYEQTGVAPRPRGEIWCGGERLETFDIVIVG